MLTMSIHAIFKATARILFATLAPVILALSPLVAHSAVTQYQFSTSGAFIATGTALDSYFTAPNNVLYGTFSYDSSATSDGVVVPGTNGNLYSYQGAISNTSIHYNGSALSFDLSAPTMDAYAGDNTLIVPPNILNWDVLFLGLWKESLDPTNYTVGEYVLDSISVGYFYPEFFTEPNLPTDLSAIPLLPGQKPSLVLNFLDAQQQRVQLSISVTELAPVPVPAAGWLFGSALLVLLRRIR